MLPDDEVPAPSAAAPGTGRQTLRTALTGLHLVAVALNQAGLAALHPGLARAGKVALVPPLLVRALLDGAAGRRAAGLALCWVGDVLPEVLPRRWERFALLVPFAGAHLCFLPETIRGVRDMRQWQPAAVGLAAVAAGAAVATGRSAGPATGVAVGIYGTMLGGTALGLAAGGRRGAAAGAAFVASDSLIAARWLGADPPWAPHLAMGLYAGALGGLARVPRAEATPSRVDPAAA
jgi:uncharacterized membrane protein YhhN